MCRGGSCQALCMSFLSLPSAHCTTFSSHIGAFQKTSLVKAFVVPGGAGQFRLSLCECSSCLCSLSWLGLSSTLFFTSRCSTFSLITEAHSQEGFKSPQNQQAEMNVLCIIYAMFKRHPCCFSSIILAVYSVIKMCMSCYLEVFLYFLKCWCICPSWSLCEDCMISFLSRVSSSSTGLAAAASIMHNQGNQTKNTSHCRYDKFFFFNCVKLKCLLWLLDHRTQLTPCQVQRRHFK